MSERRVLDPSQAPPRSDDRVPGGWWHTRGDRIVCDVCPRECTLKKGDRGFCFVRQNVDDGMVLTTYGRSTGFCIDPIEKKPLNHFYPGTSVLSFGTAGCNLGCQFCQNWEISKSREIEKLSQEASPEAIAEAARSTGCASVAYTYNDPVIWAEYAIDTAAACRERGVYNVAVTAGYITPECRGPFYAFMDAANIDLKAFTEEFYEKLTLSHLQPVLDTLRWLKHETDVWFEVTNLIIPEENDAKDETRRLCDWMVKNLGADVPIHFTGYHPDFRLTRPATPAQTLLDARQIALDSGIEHAYVGNVHDRANQSTYCSSCKKLLIERDWHELGIYALDGAACRHCGTRIPGRFATSPGTWGRKRLPVDMRRYQAEAIRQRESSPGSSPRSHPAGATPSAASRAGSHPTSAPPEPGSGSVPEPSLTVEQETAILRAARETLLAHVQKRTVQLSDPGLAGAARTVVSGVFVSLKRNGQLRSCCGMQGRPIPIHQALQQAAHRTATEDPRFPPISPSECRYLQCEVWVLFTPRRVTVRGEDRVEAVEIGRHGLQIARGDRRGLLLPGVAVDAGWDSRTFLHQVCRKAALPESAWKEDDTHLFTFEGRSLAGPLVEEDLPPALPPLDRDQVQQLARYAQDGVRSRLTGRIPSIHLGSFSLPSVAGLVLSASWPGNPGAIARGQIAVKGGIPLPKALETLMSDMVRAFSHADLDPETTERLTLEAMVLHDVATQGSAQDPLIEGIPTERRALLVIDGQHFGLALDAASTPDELLDEVLRSSGISRRPQARLYSLEVVSTTSRMTIQKPRPGTGAAPEDAMEKDLENDMESDMTSEVEDVRPCAVAGRFYPADLSDLERTVSELLSIHGTDEKDEWPAALVPHAALQFSGGVAMKTLSRIHLPRRVLVLCPWHTGRGDNWAVAPHALWDLPGGRVRSDPEFAQRLVQGVDRLKSDRRAHQAEHAIEVQLPLLRRLVPDVEVTGITVGHAPLDILRDIGHALGEVLAREEEMPFLLISGDLNHFADDARNRQLDEMALEAMETRDPARLYNVVTTNHISMCGMAPAVVAMSALERLGGVNRVVRTGYATSADTTGDRSRVVGYGGMLLA